MAARPARIAVTDQDPRAEWLTAARAALEAGELVALPTETVYGLAARADRQAPLLRLRGAKGRADTQPFTWHVGAVEALDELFPRSPLVRRVAERYWPGPLTLVVPAQSERLDALIHEGWIGVRHPAQRATAGILRALEFPVAMTSANRHGAPPAVDADEVEQVFGAELAVLFDGGRARLAESSSVARIGRGRFELLREGLIDLRALRRAAGLRIGFVCTGNTCRSPMAEGFARAVLARRLECKPDALADFGFDLRSMGVRASAGEPAAEHARALVRAAGVDLSQHRSRAAQDEDLASFDRIYCMTQSHLDALLELLPPRLASVAQLLDPGGENIPDPVGGPEEVYRRAAEQIRAALEVRAQEWA